MSLERSNKRKLDEPEASQQAAAAGLASASVGLGFFSAKKPKLKSTKFPDITQFIIQCFRENDYDELKKELTTLCQKDPSGVDKFLLKEGDVILSWALNAPNELPLKFLVALAEKDEMVPKETLQAVLKKDDSSCLRAFLYTQLGLQGAQPCTDALRKMQIEKFKLLLNIDSDTVKTFMQKSLNNPRLKTEIIKNNFETAERDFLEGNSRAEMLEVGHSASQL